MSIALKNSKYPHTPHSSFASFSPIMRSGFDLGMIARLPRTVSSLRWSFKQSALACHGCSLLRGISAQSFVAQQGLAGRWWLLRCLKNHVTKLFKWVSHPCHIKCLPGFFNCGSRTGGLMNFVRKKLYWALKVLEKMWLYQISCSSQMKWQQLHACRAGKGEAAVITFIQQHGKCPLFAFNSSKVSGPYKCQ